ncbi:MAG: DUF4271 domain-containing protein [Bacteroidales bacterium]
MISPPRISGYYGDLPSARVVNSGSTFFLLSVQDTTRVHAPDTLPVTDTAAVESDTVPSPDTIRTFSATETMQLLEAARQREQQIDSLRTATRVASPLSPPETKETVESGTASTEQVLLYPSITGYSPVKTIRNITACPVGLPGGESRDTNTYKRSIFRKTETYSEHPVPGRPLNSRETPAAPALDAPDWIVGILLISLIVVAWIRIFYNKYLASAFTGLLLYQQGKNLFRERNLHYQRFSLGMNALFSLTAGLYLYLAHDYFSLGFSGLKGFPGFLLLAVGVMLIFFIRSVICRLTGFIARAGDLFAEYMHTIMMINKVLGLVLLPLVIGLPYLPGFLVPYLVYGGLGLFLIAYLVRIYKGLQIFILNRFSIFWMILYLCALEILPYLMIYKYIDSRVL